MHIHYLTVSIPLLAHACRVCQLTSQALLTIEDYLQLARAQQSHPLLAHACRVCQLTSQALVNIKDYFHLAHTH